MAARSKHATEQAYRDRMARARRFTREKLAQYLPVPIQLASIDRDAMDAWTAQWRPVNHRSPPNGGWDWPQLHNRYRNDIKRFDLSIWHNSTLCGLALGKFAKSAVQLEVIEGSPDPNHRLKGQVLLLALEAAATAAQLAGRGEIKLIEPADGLIETYVTTYGFRVEYARSGTPYCVRRI